MVEQHLRSAKRTPRVRRLLVGTKNAVGTRSARPEAPPALRNTSRPRLFLSCIPTLVVKRMRARAAAPIRVTAQDHGRLANAREDIVADVGVRTQVLVSGSTSALSTSSSIAAHRIPVWCSLIQDEGACSDRKAIANLRPPCRLASQIANRHLECFTSIGAQGPDSFIDAEDRLYDVGSSLNGDCISSGDAPSVRRQRAGQSFPSPMSLTSRSWSDRPRRRL
ncbi:hypothetical protein ACVMB0_000220 [Bradyrhizobium sp. USDA 4451]